MSARRGAEDHVQVCGIHAVAALLRENRVRRLYVADDGGARVRQLAECAAAAAVPVVRQTRQALQQRAQERRHQGVVAEARLPQGDLPALLAAAAPLVVLDGVTDTRNLGAIMRAVRAFGGAAVVVPARRSAALTATAMRAAAGAAAQIPLVRVANVARFLQQAAAAGRHLVAAAEDGDTPLFAPPRPAGVCWVLGGEEGGIRRLVRAQCHEVVRIPTVAGEAGCLNVATACAICLAAGARSAQP